MEAQCVSCDHACSPMIAQGWGVCKPCRKKPNYDWTALEKAVPSAAGRHYVKKIVRAHLRKGAAA